MIENVDSKPIDRWLPWFFVFFFLVVFAVNGVLVYCAATSWTGLLTSHSYIKGVDYNQTLDEVAREKALGWTGILATQPDAHGVIRVDLTLTDARKLALAGAHVTARFVRPTSEGHDFEIKLDDYGRGRYKGVAQPSLAGQWDVYVEIEHPSGVYHITRRVVVP
jgi:nitrogen fixation protein FixH